MNQLGEYNTLDQLEKNQYFAQHESNQSLVDFLERFMLKPLVEFLDDNWEFILPVIAINVVILVFSILLWSIGVDTPYPKGGIALHCYILGLVCAILYVVMNIS